MFEAFTDRVIERCWEWTGGYCQCAKYGHGHKGECHQLLDKQKRAYRDGESAWEAVSISGLYLDAMSDCQIICWPCYEKNNQDSENEQSIT